MMTSCLSRSALPAMSALRTTGAGQRFLWYLPMEADLRTFASGLRNSVFMTIHPETRKVWATEMGRDLLGDDLPPDEMNIIEQGRNYGWPFCYGKNVHDDDFDPAMQKNCREPETYPSHIDIPAHSAPLGLSFFPEDGWPCRVPEQPACGISRLMEPERSHRIQDSALPSG